MPSHDLTPSALAPAALLALATLAHGAHVRVHILAGQSNMVGGGSINDLTPDLRAPRPAVDYSYWLDTRNGSPQASNSAFEPLRHLQGVVPGVSFGPELGFADALTAARPDQRIAIVKVAANGTALATHWNPNTGTLYHTLLTRVADALAQLTARGDTFSVDSFVWVQGTADANSPSASAAYAENLQSFVTTLRTDLGTPDLRVVVAQEHALARRTYVDAIRSEKAAYVAGDPLATLVDVDDLALRDDVHFTGAATYELGQRLGQALLIPSPAAVGLLVALAPVAARRRR